MAHVSNQKKKELVELTKQVKKYKVIGLIDIANYPSDHLQKLKSKFRDSVEVKVGKKSLMQRAFGDKENSEKGYDKLVPMLDKGIPALLLTNDDPFKLAKAFAKSKQMTFAKAGQVSPSDITIKAGPTKFTPGPVIGELSSAGLKTAVEQGKIVIKDDKLFVKKDEPITQKQADVLSKLGIQPIEVRVKLMAMFENGTLFHGADLEIDEAAYIAELKKLSSEAFNLAINTSYMTKETIGWLIKKAYIESLALSTARNLNQDNNGG